MKSNWFLFLCILIAGFGCATTPTITEDASGPTATCYVCRYNNDLACVNLHVKDTTPRTEFNGETYYFCSDGCRTAFLKNPKKYIPNGKTGN